MFNSGNCKLATDGYSDWASSFKVTCTHENSDAHKQAYLLYLTHRRSQTVDNYMVDQNKMENTYW